MSKTRTMWIASVVYILTRILFLVFQPVYYDSFEYVDRLKNVTWGTIILLIRSTHQPIHTLYIALAAVATIITGLPPSLIYTLLSFIFGLIAVWFWYIFLSHFYRNSKYAFWGTMLFTLFPAVWRVSTNILYESILLAFQAGTMAALFLFFETRRKKYFVAAVSSFVAAQLIFIGNILSALPIATLAIVLHPAKKKWVAVWIFTSIAFSLLIDRIALGSTSLLVQKYVSHTTDIISTQGGIILVAARILRNIIFITSELVHPLSIFLASVALWALRKERKLITIVSSFLIISFMMMQYFHGGYVGRIGILVVFPVSLLLGKLCGERPLVGIALCTILGIHIVQLGVIQRQVPYIHALISWKQSTLTHEKNPYIVTGAFTRFAFEPTTVPVFIVRDPQQDTPQLQAFIRSAEKNGSRILVDISALTFPYKQPDGWDYQLLSRQNKQGFLTSWFSNKCTLNVVYQQKSYPPLTVYEIKTCSL